jgi:hypothetical protein
VDGAVAGRLGRVDRLRLLALHPVADLRRGRGRGGDRVRRGRC